MIENGPEVLRLAVGRQTHHLVLAGVHPEASVVGEGRVEHPQGVREVDLPHRLQVVAVAGGHRSGGPLADPVHGQDRRVPERGWKEHACRMRLMVLGEQQLGVPVHVRGERPQLPAQQPLLKQLLLDPDRDGYAEGPKAARRERDIRFEQSLELEKRLVVERHAVDVARGDSGLIETVGNGAPRIAGVVLLAREAFFLRCGDNPSAVDEGRGAVVIEG